MKRLSRGVLLVLRWLILVLSLVICVVTGISITSSVLDGLDSPSGRATVLFVNRGWAEVLGDQGVYVAMLGIQCALTASLFACIVFLVFGGSRRVIGASFAVFLLATLALDLARYGDAVAYTVFAAAKLALILGCAFVVRASYRLSDG